MFFTAGLASLLALLTAVSGQQVGTNTAEVHPALTWSKCTTAGCTQVAGSVVLDSNWRWVHTTTGYTNCYNGNTWNTTICPDGVTCAAACALDGADYSGTYGITTSGNALTLKFVTTGSSKNVGSRVYLMASNTEYQVFKLRNMEFTFDVDVSNLPCGLNGALYFSDMDADGGKARFTGNKAGAQYGTGYCDSQCPRDIKFINGEANSANWTADANSPNAGTGGYGTCCDEMDIWEANSISSAVTPHPCSVSEQTRCSGEDCAINSRDDGICDPDGCDFNSYRMGAPNFYGPGLTIDTTKKITVVTQFLTSDNTANTAVVGIKRIYVQNGNVIQQSQVNVAGLSATDNVISDEFCAAQKAVFNDTNNFKTKGGLAGIDDSFEDGMVLVMSVWDDTSVEMLWLDSDYPTTADPTAPGVARGTCATTSGVPATIETTNANASVTYSNIKFGPIGSTFSGNSTTTTSSSSTKSSSTTSSSSTKTTSTTSSSSTKSTTTTSSTGGTAQKYGQCGGIGWNGPTTCASGSTCKVSNPYYSQCL
jgi:cellulose 1,4-beta-cellobiosidase